MLVVAGFAGLALVAPPAHAAARSEPCQRGAEFGPYWWGNLKATNAVTGRVVLAIESPWGIDERAYLWQDNNDNRQKFYLVCSAYNDNDGVNSYMFRYAHDRQLCLTAPSGSNGTRLVLKLCHSATGTQNFEQYADGTAIADNKPVHTYRFKHPASEACFDANGGNTGNGTPVQLFSCKAGDHQRWF
jgi:hypothetical protein